ncbi:MAG: hypothetical protein AAF388_26080 [Bacteroidota bacterium]
METGTKKDKEEYFFIGLRIHEENPDPEYYILVFVGGEKDAPLTDDGKFLLFREGPFRKYVQENFGINILPKEFVEEIGMVCELGSSLDLLRNYSYDNSAEILNTLNTLLDVIECLRLPMDKQAFRILEKLADHLTFSREYGESYFNKDEMTRKENIDAYVSLMGWIFLNSKIV